MAIAGTPNLAIAAEGLGEPKAMMKSVLAVFTTCLNDGLSHPYPFPYSRVSPQSDSSLLWGPPEHCGYLTVSLASAH